MKKLIQQILRFGVVGIIAFFIDYGVLIFLTEIFGVYYLLANAISFSASVIVNYVLSTHFVFDVNRAKTSAASNFLVFLLLSVVGLGLNQLFMLVLVDNLGLFYMLSKIVATAVVMVYNFITRKLFLERR